MIPQDEKLARVVAAARSYAEALRGVDSIAEDLAALELEEALEEEGKVASCPLRAVLAASLLPLDEYPWEGEGPVSLEGVALDVEAVLDFL